MVETSSSRSLIKSMLVIGSAQFVNILISIVRMKMLAVLLGASGVGLFSIYNSLLGMVQQTAGLGLGTSGVREIAAARGEEETLSRVRRVLFAALFIQGTLATLVVWLLQEHIAIWLLGDAVRATEIGLLGLATLIGLISVAQTALLQGLRKIGELGLVTAIGAFFSTIVGLATVWLLGESGVIWFFLVQPLSVFLVALYFTQRLPKPIAAYPSLLRSWEVWKPMAKLGASIMAGGLITAATQLAVRSRISQELGFDTAGYFAAAWSMSMTYVGFLLHAMAPDYYPRLTEVIHDKNAANRLMNDQTQLALAIGGPVLLLLIGLAPWVITLLYSGAFEPAITLLQWQMFGNIFKMASWAISFSIVAATRGKTFFLMELSFNIVFFGMVFFFLPYVGLEVTGYAFLVGYLVYMTIAYILARSIHGFRWQALSIRVLWIQVGLGSVLLVLGLMDPYAAAMASPLIAGAMGIYGLRTVLRKIGMHGRVPKQLYRIFMNLGWPI